MGATLDLGPQADNRRYLRSSGQLGYARNAELGAMQDEPTGMIRFRRLFELTSDVDRRRFTEASDLFRAAFPHEADAIDRIAHMLLNRRTMGFDPIFLLATDGRDRISGFAFVYYFSDLDYGYLQYFASDPRKPARGIGVALYEALARTTWQRAGHADFLDVPPVEPEKVKDRASPDRSTASACAFTRATTTQKVVGTLWDVEANPRNDGYLTTLLYDPFGPPSFRWAQRDARRSGAPHPRRPVRLRARTTRSSTRIVRSFPDNR